MHPELESLVKAYEAVQTASPAHAPELFADYGSKIEESAARMRIDRALLDRAVRWQHGRASAISSLGDIEEDLRSRIRFASNI